MAYTIELRELTYGVGKIERIHYASTLLFIIFCAKGDFSHSVQRTGMGCVIVVRKIQLFLCRLNN